MKKKLDYRMDEDVEQDFRKFLNHFQDQQHQKEVVNHKLLILTILIPLTSEKEGLVDPQGRYIPYLDSALRDPCVNPTN